MNTLTAIAFAISVALNAILLLNAAKRRRAGRHTHTWTPWSDWRTLRVSGAFHSAYFRRVRYCTECAQENKQTVGEHECGTRDKYGSLSCTHLELYTAIFDPMYELKQINKDLEELQ